MDSQHTNPAERPRIHQERDPNTTVSFLLFDTSDRQMESPVQAITYTVAPLCSLPKEGMLYFLSASMLVCEWYSILTLDIRDKGDSVSYQNDPVVIEIV